MSESQATAVLVTGAGQGIGRACAERFSAGGWSVHSWDRQDVSEPGWSHECVDVTDAVAVADAATRLPALGAVVTCAGVASRASVIETTPEEWGRVIDVNLSGVFHTTKYALPALVEGRGVAVTIGSITGSVGFMERSVYSAAKAGVISLTRSLAIEWAQHGVRAVCVSPGFTRTELVQQGINSGRTAVDDILQHTPQARLLEPAEIAEAIWQLSQPGLSAITGSEVLVDAGFNALTGF